MGLSAASRSLCLYDSVGLGRIVIWGLLGCIGLYKRFAQGDLDSQLPVRFRACAGTGFRVQGSEFEGLGIQTHKLP